MSGYVGKILNISAKFVDFLEGVYGPQVVEQFPQMDAWLCVNPRRRPRNQPRFCVNWCNRWRTRETRLRSRQEQRDEETERELRVGAGPASYNCSVCHRRLLAAFLPATCPHCGAKHSLERA